MKFSLTSAQQTFYTEKVTHDIPVWNQALYFMFPGQCSDEKLAGILNEIIEENEFFRLNFTKDENGNLFQSIAPHEKKEFDIFNFDNIKELEDRTQRIANAPSLLCEGAYEFHIFHLAEKFGVILRIHHMICDGFCITLFINKLKSKLGLAEKETKIYSYQRHIEEELLYKESKRFERNIAFWNRTLSQNFSNTLFDIGASDLDYSADEKFYSFSNNSVKQVKKICEEENIPFSAFIYAMFAVYVKRVLEIDDFSVAMPVLNRLTEDDMHTLGLYMHSLPLIMHVSDEDTFISLLEKTYDSVVALLKNQKFTQYDIHNNCTFEKKNKPLFDVTVSFEPKYFLSDCESNIFYANKLTTPLEIHFYEGKDDNLSVRVRYRTGIFRESNITDMLACFEGILGAFAEDPYALISKASIESKYTLTEEEKQKILYDFNDTAVDYPTDKLAHELFEEQAEKTPDKTAVVACDKTLTYEELNEQSNRIANALIQNGVGVGDIVAFSLPRRSYLVSLMFGIVKCGAVFMPLNTEYPADVIENIISENNVSFVVNEDNIADLINHNDSSRPNIHIGLENICYCMYTSGSTGAPKGILITHRNLLHLCNSSDKNIYHAVMKEDFTAIASLSTVTFDPFIVDSILALLHAKTVILANEEQLKDQDALSKLLTKHPSDMFQTTPTKIKLLTTDKNNCEYLRGVKAIVLGGEVLDASLYYELKKLTDAEIYNFYGPTEITVWATYSNITDSDITIGKPFANTQIYIVDKYMKPVPIGVTGELCIAGDGVAAGYLNRPELTAEKFIDNPFGKGKLYKTGDLAYWREDGNIVYVGRNDFQVKIRGLRIELSAIESAMLSVDGISQTAVVVRKNDEDRQLIIAYYTGKEISAKDFRAHISKQLPKYMLPHIFTHLDEIPLNSSGKINRKALPEVDLENIETGVEYVAPETEAEKVLVDSAQKVLGCENISVLDSFFDLGGDSLKAIELIAKLNGCGYNVDTKTIFECENIKELASRLTINEDAEEKITYDSVIPATPAQMRVYTAQIMDGNSTLYNIPRVFRVKNLDADRLQTAINKLIKRHESLRTHFENRDGKIYQVIDETADLVLEARENEDINSFVRPFDLTKSPLIRAGYFENTVMIDFHHIIADGSAIPVFFRELNEFYMGREPKDNI